MGTVSGFIVGAIVGAAVVVVFFWKPWEPAFGWLLSAQPFSDADVPRSVT